MWEELGEGDHGPQSGDYDLKSQGADDTVYSNEYDLAGAPSNPDVLGGIKAGNSWSSGGNSGNADALAAMAKKVTAGDMLVASQHYDGMKAACKEGACEPMYMVHALFYILPAPQLDGR